MKRTPRTLLSIIMMLFMLAGCSGTQLPGQSPDIASPDAAGTQTSAASLPPDASPTPVPTPIPDPSAVTLVIEDFNDVTNIRSAVNPLNLSSFGISDPEFSLDSEYAQEGTALVSTLAASSWCQAYELGGKRLNVFKSAAEEYYLRLWIATPDNTDLGITVCLGTSGGSQRSYLDASRAIVTSYDGSPVSISVGNDSSDAGDNSSVRIPEGFAGYVAFPLSAPIPWKGYSGITSLTKVNYLKFDIRPSVTSPGDRYVLDAICLSDSPVAELGAGGSASDSGTATQFESKSEELEYLLTQLLNRETEYRFCPEYDPEYFPGVKALWFTGADYGSKSTKVFAYIGFPEGASAKNPVPAVVLMHGGGGFAYPSWVKLWNDRGYAAIAVCNTGYYPADTGITDFYSASSWTRSVPKDVLASDPRVMGPDNDGMYSSGGAVNRMWMYHAVAQTILAHNLLRADPRVDPGKIGLTGISWGGVITSIAIGYDTRFSFAIPVYGSAYLNEALSWMKDNFASKETQTLWEASNRLGLIRNTKVLWLCWADDNCFSINSNSKSYLNARGSALCIVQNLGHGHIEGWSRPEIYRFADAAVRGGGGLASLKTSLPAGRNISFSVNVPSDASGISARVCYITEPLSYSSAGRLHISGQETIDQEWHFVDCTVSGNNVSAVLPAEAYSYYVELTTYVGGAAYISCSEFTDCG